MIAVPSGNIGNWPNPVDKKLAKRITWIIRCAGASSFYSILFNDFKSNAFKSFIEVITIRNYFDPTNPWRYEIADLQPHQCYFLGTFPWYWNFRTHTAVHPMTSYDENSVQFQMRLQWKDIDSRILEAYTDEEIKFFHGEEALKSITAQRKFLIYLGNRLNDCLKEYYPKEAKPTPGTVMTPDGLKNWPGVQMTELRLPGTNPPFQPGPGQKIIKVILSVSFGTDGAKSPKGMLLQTTIE